jgi:aryl-alcohol dehydrogenase
LKPVQPVADVVEDDWIRQAGPLAGRCSNSLRPAFGSNITVSGAGSVGISAIMAAGMAGCTTTIGVDIKHNRLALAPEFGTTHTINKLELEPVSEIGKITRTGADYALDMTGWPDVIRQALERV